MVMVTSIQAECTVPISDNWVKSRGTRTGRGEGSYKYHWSRRPGIGIYQVFCGRQVVVWRCSAAPQRQRRRASRSRNGRRPLRCCEVVGMGCTGAVGPHVVREQSWVRVVGAGLVMTPEVANINHLLILFLVTSHHGGRTVLCGSGHKREREGPYRKPKG